DIDVDIVVAVDVGTHAVATWTPDKVSIASAQETDASGQRQRLAFVQTSGPAVDFQSIRVKANCDLSLAHLYPEGRVDRCIRPVWCTGHLLRMHDKVRSGLRQQKFARGLEVVKQPVECGQMGVADGRRTIRERGDIVIGFLECNRWKLYHGNRRPPNEMQAVRFSRKSREVNTARRILVAG